MPLVDPPPLISQGDSNSLSFPEAEVLAVIVIVGRHPAHPNAGGVLSREHSHRVEVLRNREQPENGVGWRGGTATLTYCCDAAVVSTFFRRLAVKNQTELH